MCNNYSSISLMQIDVLHINYRNENIDPRRESVNNKGLIISSTGECTKET